MNFPPGGDAAENTSSSNESISPDSTSDARSTGGDAPAGGSPRDLLVPYILLAVSLQRAHGYLIEEYLKSLGFFGMEKSVLYRTLRGLEKDGLLQSAWEMSTSGPARRVYTITGAGQAHLNNGLSALQSYRRMIDQFFALYQPASPSAPVAETSLRPEDAHDGDGTASSETH
ncbi:MAG: hypothetical protein NVSMB42_18350 [Herpetosiphon sp.]